MHSCANGQLNETVNLHVSESGNKGMVNASGMWCCLANMQHILEGKSFLLKLEPFSNALSLTMLQSSGILSLPSYSALPYMS